MKCDKCNGTGEMPAKPIIHITCPKCDGAGEVSVAGGWAGYPDIMCDKCKGKGKIRV